MVTITNLRSIALAIFLSSWALFCSTDIFAQSLNLQQSSVAVLAETAPELATYRGTITAVDGEVLSGASVRVKGTTRGTLADGEGRYEIEASAGETLIFNFIGYATKEVVLGDNTTVNVSLDLEDALADEVVITALGIERQAKSLTSAAQNVNTEDLSKARALNVGESLSGKVAGISVSPSGAGVGAPARIILRGNRSISGNSQPLYVVDGVPILGDITDVNPDDIESISVLKGPNAAALYGNRANNGAIVITTKRGATGGFNISVSSTYMANQPIILTDYQNEYGQGNTGQYSPASEQAWGPRMGTTVDHWSPDPNFPTQTYTLAGQPDNVSDFFQTGYNWATNVSINAGTEKTQTYFSYTFTDAQGIVPNNNLARHNAHVRITNKLADKLTLDTKLNYIREDVDNQLPEGENFANPVRHALRLPRNIRTEDVSIFEYTDVEGSNRQHYWNPGSNGGANPYWSINRATNQRDVDRIIGFASLKYEITDNISIMARTALDRFISQGEDRLWVDNYIIGDNGRYTVSRGEFYEWNNDLLLSYNDNITDDISLSVNLGANARKERGSSLSANTGDALIVPNFFTIGNTSDNRANHSFGSPRDVNSIYGFAQLGYKDAIYLDITGRNDWSSTLPIDNASFFYPSFGLSAILSELTDMPDWVTFLKLRGSYAIVGNDTGPFQTLRTASVGAGGNNGFLSLSTTIPNENLLPEETTSLELGADLRFFNNRVGLDFTWYQSNSKNQLFSIALPVGSGASQFFTNGGDVENKGIEMVLSLRPVQTNDFQWDILFNFTRNRSTVIQINDQRPSITVAGDFLRSFRIEQGRPWGEVYSRGFQKDDQGRVIVGENGLPLVTDGLTELVANYNPDWLGGIRNELNYKGLNLSFLVDVRVGGSVTSLTNAIIYADGLTEQTLQGREGGLIFGQDGFFDEYEAVTESGEPNNFATTAEDFWRNFGGRNAPVGEAFSYSATNVRMRELVFGYRLPVNLTGVKGVTLSVVGRNLFFFYNAAGDIDPEVLVGTGKASEGFQSFAPPTMRSIGGSIKIDF